MYALLACSAFDAERAAMWAAVEHEVGQPAVSAAQTLPADQQLARIPACWETPSGVTVLRLWMVSSSSSWLRKCGGGGRRYWRRVVRPAVWPMLRPRRITGAAVRPLC
jgi:hypothetical protein